VCRLAIALKLFTVTSSKYSINRITNPNPVPSYYHVTIYIFVFCHCSLFLHRTILLVPNSASILLTSCSSLALSFTRQYVASAFYFATHRKNPMFIVHPNPLSPSTPIVHHIMPLLATYFYTPSFSQLFLKPLYNVNKLLSFFIAIIFCLLTPTKFSLILIISYHYSFHSHKISHNPIRSNVSLSHS
jgi:hypothetical protein